MSASVRHVGIVVYDVENWLEFLQDLLKFRIWIDQIEEGDFISHLIGIPNTKVRTIKFKDFKGGVIEILKFIHQPTLTSVIEGLQPNSLGITHIALEVDSLDSRLVALSAKGFLPIGVPKLSEDGSAKVCYLRGPENVLFELVGVIP